MNLAELVDHLRTDILRDVAQPPLWSDAFLIQQLNEAEAVFARHTHILRDDTSDFTRITTQAGNARYKLDKRIIHVVDVWDDAGRSLRSLSRKKVPRLPGYGRPVTYTLDAAQSSIRLAPPPDDEIELQMLVARKPLRKMAQASQSPEIPEEYHADLALYGAWRAMLANGPEGGEPEAYQTYRAEWSERLRTAKREVYHERMGPNAHVRTN